MENEENNVPIDTNGKVVTKDYSIMQLLADLENENEDEDE
jgi:hypothetical protein